MDLNSSPRADDFKKRSFVAVPSNIVRAIFRYEISIVNHWMHDGYCSAIHGHYLKLYRPLSF